MAEQSYGDRRGRERWVWLSLLPLGWGSWAPIVGGIRYRRARWIALGVFCFALNIAGIVVESGSRSGNVTGGRAGVVSLLLLSSWFGGIVTAFAIRARVRRELAAGGEALLLGRADPGQPQRDQWPWVSLAPLGLGAWAPIIAGVRCRVRLWVLGGVINIAAAVVGWVLAMAADSPAGINTTEAAIAWLLLVGSWLSGIAMSFAIRPAYDERRGLPANRPTWPRPSPRSREWSARYALIAFAATFGSVIALGLLLRYVAGVRHLQVGLGVLMVDVILLAGLVPLARRRGLSLGDLGVRPTRSLRSLGLVGLAMFVYLAIGAVWSLVFTSPSLRHAANILANIRHADTLDVVVTVFAVSLSAPIVEEIFFRGLVYRSLRNRLGVPQAALLAGMLFGLVHITGYPLVTLPVKAAFGVIACLLYERTGSLLPGIALHAFVDASGVDIDLTGNDYVVLIVAGILIAAILIRAAVGWWRQRPEQLPPLSDLAAVQTEP